MTLKSDRNKGFTLVELLVAILIGAILMISVVSMFIQQSRAMALQEDLVNLEQNLRSGMDLLYRDVRMSGAYSAGAFPPFTIGDIDYTGDGVADVASEGGGGATDAIQIQLSPDPGQKIVSYNGAAANMQLCRPTGLSVGQLIPLSSVDTPPETRSIEVTLVGPVSCPGQGCDGDNCDKVNFSPGNSFYNTPGGLASDYENGRLWNNLQTITYFVTTDFNADGVTDDPALMSVLNASSPSVVAFGITGLQVEYGVEVDVGGIPTIKYTTDPAIWGAEIIDTHIVRLTLIGETRGAHSLGGARSKRTRTMTTEVQVRNLFY